MDPGTEMQHPLLHPKPLNGRAGSEYVGTVWHHKFLNKLCIFSRLVLISEQLNNSLYILHVGEFCTWISQVLHCRAVVATVLELH